jgi:hypothetical protein
VFARLLVGYVLSLPVLVSLASTTKPAEEYTLQIRMSSPVPDLVQVFSRWCGLQW